jgi:hypothetical protein
MRPAGADADDERRQRRSESDDEQLLESRA